MKTQDIKECVETVNLILVLGPAIAYLHPEGFGDRTIGQLKMLPRWVIKGCALLLSTAGICVSVQHAIAHERQRRIDLHQIYQQTDRDFFDNQLGDADVQWSDLTKKGDDGETFLQGDYVLILVDRENQTEDVVRRIIQHEACHILTEEAGRNHGPVFQDCMTRFSR